MKIAIYDIIHLEQVIPWVKLARYNKNQIHFFTSGSFRAEIQNIARDLPSSTEFFYKPGNEAEIQFLYHVREILKENRYDLIILNSVDSRHYFWYRIKKSLPSMKMVINVHDVNNLFLSSFSFNLRKNIRHIGKHRLSAAADGFIVNSDTIANNMIARRLTDKPVWPFHIVIFEEETIIPHEDIPFTIVIPGTIDHRRRDYDLALDSYTKLIMTLDRPVVLVLAGRPHGTYGAEIIKKAQALNLKGGMIRFWHDELAEDTFRKQLYGCHLIWSPVRIHTSILDDIPETYGQSKTSGSIQDAIRFAKPLLIPVELRIPEELRSSVLSYTDHENWLKKIQGLYENRVELQQIWKAARENSEKFRIEYLAGKLENILSCLRKTE